MRARWSNHFLGIGKTWRHQFFRTPLVAGVTSLVLPWLVVLLLFSGCRTRIGAERAPVSAVYLKLNASALDKGTYSDFTRAVLRRYDYERLFRSDPTNALHQLHEKALRDERRDVLLALAELNYSHAQHLRRSVKPGEPRRARDYYLASAVYAYYYLLVDTDLAQAGGFGPRPHLARELYNHALAQGFLAPGATNAVVLLQEGTRELLIGPVQIQLNTNAFPWPVSWFTEFAMADAYNIRGLSVRNRQAGLGAPLIATAERGPVELAPPRGAVTMFLRPEGDLKNWEGGRLKASLELYPGYPGGRVLLDGRSVPLEIDATAPLAYALNNTTLWELGRKQFFSGREIMKTGIYRLQPYKAGAIPVVFVHGTFSSPVRWAEMWNTLVSDPVLSQRYQFWAYLYNSGSPVAWSAANLRDALRQTVARLDPSARDPALRHIVLIGHSQGGLLAKLSVLRTDDKLWRLLSDEKLEDLQLPADVTAELRRTLFVEPVSGVTRVVFVATPHRGSLLATRLIRKLAAKVVSLPGNLLWLTREEMQAGGTARLPPMLRQRLPTSLDGMSPNNPAVLRMAEMQPVKGVTCHSIIAVKGHRPVEQDDDGVVSYQSAHVTYSASEVVVRSRHSCQNNPAAIEEVRRILLLHLAEFDGGRESAWN